MSIMDAKLTMADSDTLASISAGSTSTVGDVIDLGQGKNAFGETHTPDIGEAADLTFNVACEDEDFASSGSPVVTISLVTAASASLSSGAVTLASVITDKTPDDGDVIGRLKVPKGTVKQYVATRVTVASATLTAGKVTTWIDNTGATPPSQKK